MPIITKWLLEHTYDGGKECSVTTFDTYEEAVAAFNSIKKDDPSANLLLEKSQQNLLLG